MLLADAQTAGAVTPSPTCTSATCTVTFSETGAPVTWNVPDGASPLRVTMYGADGGLADGGGMFGSGAEVQATVSANNATPLTINVGGTASYNSAGYNGGGEGETGSGAGGGATELYEGATPVLIAGGGGGGGLTRKATVVTGATQMALAGLAIQSLSLAPRWAAGAGAGPGHRTRAARAGPAARAPAPVLVTLLY